jgi:uncharacterized membrane protein
VFGLLFGTTLLVPATMIGFGLLWKKHPPKDVNTIYGYRTPMSMKNDETWRFAHQYHAKIWLWIGLIVLVLSMIFAYVFRGNYEVSYLWIISIQTFIMLLSLIPTEKALKKKFDSDGRPK